MKSLSNQALLLVKVLNLRDQLLPSRKTPDKQIPIEMNLISPAKSCQAMVNVTPL